MDFGALGVHLNSELLYGGDAAIFTDQVYTGYNCYLAYIPAQIPLKSPALEQISTHL